ncbi:dUTP diphosphatase [uncultured Senegalimassilia sp.]|uniref:dUTP diphosphatase n=1 Tax=uncultured Senegalimassilia sp. TaxID=1714350 RepID=UPI002585D08C|nr:dUTP diphosphatase [uncultured Senegalimassilia sp.]
MTEVQIEIKTLNEAAKIPSYAYSGDAGMDLRASESLTLQPFERALVPTGLAIALPEGYAGFVLPRSGLAIKNGITVVNAPGLIDSNYRGELKVILQNTDPHEPFTIHGGDRIAQLVVMPVPHMSFTPVDALSSTERGEGGFGSSGISE